MRISNERRVFFALENNLARLGIICSLKEVSRAAEQGIKATHKSAGEGCIIYGLPYFRRFMWNGATCRFIARLSSPTFIRDRGVNFVIENMLNDTQLYMSQRIPGILIGLEIPDYPTAQCALLCEIPEATTKFKFCALR